MFDIFNGIAYLMITNMYEVLWFHNLKSVNDVYNVL